MVWDTLVWLLLTTEGVYLLVQWLIHGGERNPRTFPSIRQGQLQPVSVVICAHNNGPGLERHLPHILAQDYLDGGAPNFEVVVVDDRSTDGTAALLARLVAELPQLRVVTLQTESEKRFPGKKGALAAGVAAARFETLLLTDADCRPASRSWMKWMVLPLGDERYDIVAGYGGYDAAPGLLNRFIRAETVLTFSQMHDLTAHGRPYMAVGRNLAVRKAVFERAQSHSLWTATVSGDDDMLVRIAGTASNVYVERYPEAFTYSAAKETWTAYNAQKQRHLSTGKYYRWSIKWILGAANFAHTLFWLVWPVLLIADVSGTISRGGMAGFAFSVALARIIMWHWQQRGWTKALKETGLRYFLWVFDPLLAAYHLFFAPYIFWKNKRQWT